MADKDFNYYISKEKIDNEFIKWLCEEFNLKPDTVIPIGEISSSPEDLYNIINNMVDKKGYGFDSIEQGDDEEEKEHDKQLNLEFESKRNFKHLKLFENFK